MAIVSYPYDDTGHASTNLVKREPQVLSANNSDPYRYFVPTFAPLYETNFLLEGQDALGNPKVLTKGIDYNFNLPYLGATRANGAVVWGGITIINATIQGTIYVTYQCIGGRYSADRDYVIRAIAENNYNPRVVAWDQLTSIQETFPPSNHPQPLDTFTGYADLINAIQAYQSHPDEFQTLKDLIWKHTLDNQDPHNTKALLGEYAKINYVDQQVNNLNEKIGAFTVTQENNAGAIANLTTTITENNNTSITRFLKDEQLIDKNATDITALQHRATADELTISQNKTSITALEQRAGVIEQTAAAAAQTTASIQNSLSDLTSKFNSSRTEFQYVQTVPALFVANVIVVGTPHMRFMVWSESLKRYVRAPWDQPGIVVYHYSNPSVVSGYLPVRADQVYNQADYPDLAQTLGLSGSGQFSLVEARGQFIRVLDNGVRIDVNRSNLSLQKGSNASHTHDSVMGESKFTSPGNYYVLGAPYNNAGGVDNGVHSPDYPVRSISIVMDHTHTLEIKSEGGNEARPDNIAMSVWISY